MNANEAINKLKQLRDNNQKQQLDNTSNAFAKSLNIFKTIIVSAMADLTDLLLKNEPSVTVKNFPKPKELQKVEVTNFPEHKERPEIEKVEVTNQPEIVFDTKEIEKRLLDLKLGLEKIPQQLKTSSTEALVKSGNLNNSIESILKAIKSIELKPEIKVNTPKLEIPAPIVNIPPIKIPEFPKKITADVNFSEVLASLEELLTELTYLEQRGIHISNFGEAPVSVSIPTFRDGDGKVSQAIINSDGSQKTQVIETIPTDTTKLNPSVTITEVTVGTVTTKTIQKTIGTDVYQKTVAIDSSDNSISISAWSKL